MADYWKSNPRKYCEYCDCWFASNPISIRHHERGNRHKCNVNRKLEKLKQEAERGVYVNNMVQGVLSHIEKAALNKYKTDKKDDIFVASAYGREVKQRQNIVQSSEDKTSNHSSVLQWIESKTVDGKIYYHNPATREIIWKKRPIKNEVEDVRNGNTVVDGNNLELPESSLLPESEEYYDPDKEDILAINKLMNTKKEARCSVQKSENVQVSFKSVSAKRRKLKKTRSGE
ncbi:hypothetical protein ACOME3_004105 [Neoechinorhynchus agilis]